jgi:sulfatase maturation enzyme AslB (radical SAM superfamily)
MHNIYVVLMAECNLACTYCWYVQGVERIPQIRLCPTSLSDWLRQWHRVNGIHSITYTGGEPFLHPQIADFLDISMNDSEVEKRVITNGTLIDNAWAARLKSKNVGVCLSLVGLSIDSNQAVGRNRDCAVTAARLLAEYDVFPRSLTCVLTRKNIREMEGIVALADSLGFDVSFQPAAFYTHNAICLSNCTKAEKRHLVEQLLSWGASRNRLRYAGLVIRAIRERRLPLQNCTFALNSIVINSDGNVYPCFQHMGRDTMGSIFGTPLDEMLRNRKEIFRKSQPGSCFTIDCCGVF